MAIPAVYSREADAFFSSNYGRPATPDEAQWWADRRTNDANATVAVVGNMWKQQNPAPSIRAELPPGGLGAQPDLAALLDAGVLVPAGNGQFRNRITGEMIGGQSVANQVPGFSNSPQNAAPPAPAPASPLGMGGYLSQLQSSGVISPDKLAGYNGQGFPMYVGNDGNIYMPHWDPNKPQADSGDRPNQAGLVERIPLSNLQMKDGQLKDITGATSYFLNPQTGAQTGTGQANFNKADLGEMAALGLIGAMTGGAALSGMGLLGGASAGSATGAGTAGAVGGAAPSLTGLPFSGGMAGAGTGFSTGAGALGTGATSFGTGALGMDAALGGFGAAAGGGTAVLGAGGGAPANVGGGLSTGSSGTGLSLGGGNTGLTAQAGSGLNLTAPSTTGITATSPGASAIGGGLGTTGLAGGSGSLLGAAGLAGTTTLSNGTILQGTGSAASAAGAGGSGAATTPTTTPGSNAMPELIPGIPNQLLGSALGGLLGSQGQQSSTTQARELPGYLQAPVGDLVNRTQNLLGTQMPQAQQLGSQLISQGQGLLSAPVAGNGYGQINIPQGSAMPTNQAMGNGFNTVPQGTSVAGNGTGQISLAQGPAMPNTPVATNGVGKIALKQGPAAPTYAGAGNGVGQIQLAQGPAAPNSKVAANGFGAVKMDAPNTPSNPYLAGMASDIQRRTQEMLGQNNLAIKGNAVGVGGLGGSRQGVAQGTAASKAADYISGNLANLYGTAYDADMNRALSKYGTDVGFYDAQRNTDATLRAQDLSNYNQALDRNLNKYTADQGFFTGQRGQDLTKYQTDLNNYNQGQDRNMTQYGLDQNFYGQQRNSDLAQRGQDIGLYDAQKNRDLSKYTADQSFYQGQRGQDLQRLGLSQDFYSAQRGQDLTQNAQNLDTYNQGQNRALQQYGLQSSFYANQRGQDLAQVGVGGGLLSQGLQTQFDPLKNAANIYSPFSGMGTTTTSQSSGGGAQGALGGALGMAQFGSNMGWW